MALSDTCFGAKNVALRHLLTYCPERLMLSLGTIGIY